MKMKEEILDIGYLKLSYKAWGHSTEKTPVVFFHGWLDNANSFDDLIHCLPDDRLYLAFDLPGHGHSDHKPVGQLYHFLDGVGDLRRVLDELGYDKVSVVGHSLGAAMLSVLASLYPEIIESVCLIEAVGPIASEEAHSARQLKESIDKQLLGVGRNMVEYPSLEAMGAAREKGMLGLEKAAARRLVERSYTAHGKGYKWSTDPRLRVPSPMRLSESQVKGILTKLKVPLQLIIAERSLIPEDVIKQRLSYFDQYDLVTLPGGHHLHMEESVSSVAKALTEFWGSSSMLECETAMEQNGGS
jgi:pimeloyl-ACP methyl ester carboxylesterase